MKLARSLKAVLLARVFLSLLLGPLSALAGGADAEMPFRVDAKGAVLIDAASGRVLYGQDEDEAYPMASTTKIMTALVALENSALEETVTASERASGVPGTSVYLGVGERLSMEHMLYGLLLRSGNDAAVAIAEHVAGSVPAFAEMMNERAAELAANARFVNPHGLTEAGHRASALGLARIMRQAMTIDEFRMITGTSRKVIPWAGNEFSRTLENKNRLLSSYEGATGGKTGYTAAAGRCLVFSARREGMELIGAVLNCPTWFDTATAMLDYGFEHFRPVTLLRGGEEAGRARVSGGAARDVSAVATGDLTAAVALGEDASLSCVLYELSAPVQRGQLVGTASIVADGRAVATVELAAGERVEAGGLMNALRRLLRRWTLSLQGDAVAPVALKIDHAGDVLRGGEEPVR